MAGNVLGATRFNAPGIFQGVAFSPDARVLVGLVAGKKRARLHRFRVPDGQPLDPITVPGTFTELAVLPGGDFLLWSREGVARFTADGERIWHVGTAKTGAFDSVALSTDGTSFATHGRDSIASIFDARTGKREGVIKEDGEIYAFAFAPEGRTFATGGEKGVVRVFDQKTRKERAKRKSTKVLALAFSPDGERLAGGHGQGRILFWDAGTLTPIATRHLPTHRFFAEEAGGDVDRGPAACRWLAFLPGGGLVSYGNEHALRWWTADGAEVRRVTVSRQHAQGSAMAIAPGGAWIATGATASGLGVWSGTGERVTGEPALAEPRAIALTRDRLVVATPWTLVSLRRGDGTRIERPSHGPNTAIGALPDGELLVVGDDHARVVRELSDAERRLFDNAASSPRPRVSISRDGKTALYAADLVLEVWDLTRSVRTAALSHEQRVTAFAYGPGDGWVVSVSEDVRIWRPTTPDEPVRTIALPDGAPAYCGGVAVSSIGWIAVSVDRSSGNHDSNSLLVFIDPRSGAVTASLPHPVMRLGQLAFVDHRRVVVVDSAGRLRTADAETGTWLDEPAAEDIDVHGFAIRALAASDDGTEIAHVDGWGNVVVRAFPRTGEEATTPFDLGLDAAAEKPAEDPTKLFEKRLAGTRFLYAGKFQSSALEVRTSKEFREETLRELGGEVTKKSKDATHFVPALIPYTKHVPSKVELEIDARIAKGERVVKMSEKKLNELLLPTFAEARAMLRGEIPDGIARWNRWRSRWQTEYGEFISLAGMDLEGIDLRGANLGAAPLQEAKLARANLAGAELYDAVFRGADLRGANLDGARCGRVDFTQADLREARLGAQLGGARFDGADLRGADLSGADLSYTSLAGARLEGARFPDGYTPS
ncbi:pentapeptide repeat-containing protein [Polyangium jinanense]|uniref:pentapeptide repeat-containing protein n=1 Tax=Polyangium jinanense TaxID=2829994 RepID=UPI0023419D65|nr:pentapeptide repeat-containing protein [Polyangium jinanense]MDC3959964.1 pentapeptide repeat-containing protein [Polyangium jinanense]